MTKDKINLETFKYDKSRNEARCKAMVKVIDAECVACGACVDVCPQDAIVVDDVAVIDQDKCVDCGACIDECPSDAIVE